MVLFQEVRWHGRGGQGAWTASSLLARAALYEGKHIQSFPEFGPERMGAPMKAYTRISDDPIDIHCSVYTPNVVVVLDPTLLKTVNVTEGLRKDGEVIINTQETPEELRKRLKLKGRKIWTIPATDLAIRIIKRYIPNTAMLGAAIRATGIVKLESAKKAIEEWFPTKIAETNIQVIDEAWKEAKTE